MNNLTLTQKRNISIKEKALKRLLKEKSIKFIVSKEFNSIYGLVTFAITKGDYSVPRSKTISKTTGIERVQSIGISRSLEDLFILCNSYFPGTRLIDIVQVLRELNPERMYCYTFGKSMFRITQDYYRAGLNFNGKFGL